MGYIAIILVCRVAQHLCNKQTSNDVRTMQRFFKFGAWRNLISAVLGILLILIVGKGFKCDLPTVLISVFSGLMLAAGTGLGIINLKNGTVALSSMFSTAGLLIPCFAGIFLFDEPMSVWQWVGVAIFFVAAYFLISSSSKSYKKFSLKSLLFLIALMLSEGAIMLAQQMFSFYVPEGDVSVFSFISFGTACLVLFVCCFIKPKDSGALSHDTTPTETTSVGEDENKLTRKLLIMGAVLAVAVFIINQLATLALETVSPVILFTFINGGSTIIGSIIAALFFGEKFTLKSIIGIVLGVSALIIIKVL